MGSRITRAIYKDERKQPIQKQRQQEIKTLIVCFLGSINAITSFLFGYLFRPHIRAPHSLPIFITILALFLYLQLRQINRSTLITSVALFLTVILTKIIGIELSLLKAVLILITTALSSALSFQIASSPFLQTLFLWLAYSAFGLGVKLSLVISKIKLESNQAEALGKEQTFLVQFVFSLVGIMSVFLISFGKKILKIKASDTEKHSIFGKQLFSATLNFILMASSFGFKSKLQISFLVDLCLVFATVIMLIIISKTSMQDYTWTIVCVLAVISHSMMLLTEGEGQIAAWVNGWKMLMVELAVTDSLQRWISWSRHGGHQPVLIVFLYFSAFYLSQLSNIGVRALAHFSISATEAVAMGSYAILRTLHYFDKGIVQNYEPIVV